MTYFPDADKTPNCQSDEGAGHHEPVAATVVALMFESYSNAERWLPVCDAHAAHRFPDTPTYRISRNEDR